MGAEIRESERAAEQSRRKLVAFVSHDLRTPLARIRAVSEAIADGVVADDEMRDHAKHIERRSIRLAEMVDDLFEMSKINAGAVQIDYDRVALDEVVDDVLAAHRIAAERAGVVLRADVPVGAVRVIGRDRALVRVLSKFVAKASPHPGGRNGGTGDRRRRDGAWARVDDAGGASTKPTWPASSTSRTGVQRPRAWVGFVAAERLGPGPGDRGRAGSGEGRRKSPATPSFGCLCVCSR